MSWPQEHDGWSVLTLPPEDRSIGWPSWNSSGELALVAQIRESWWLDQLSYQPGPDPGLWIGPSQNLYHLRMVGRQKEQAVPKLPDFHDRRQPQDNWEESWWESNVDGVTIKEPKTLNQTHDMAHCKQHLRVKICGQRDVLWDILWDTTASTMRRFLCFVLLLLLLLLFAHVCIVCVCLSICLHHFGDYKVKGRYEGWGEEWVGLGTCCEIHKESKSLKKMAGALTPLF